MTIDGFGPLPVHRPKDAAGVCDVVRSAAEAGQAVYPIGGGTTLDIGCPPTKPGIAVSTTALNRVIDYPARDMTVTVQAGITVAKLQALLAAENQWLPVDVPNPDRATIGGVVAANLSGPHRFGHGSLRDYAIGISFVSDEGIEVKAGGRVVKNVAGYDLMKLQTGALGTLGILTQLTFKVKPRPERSQLLSFGVMDENLEAVLDRIHASNCRPVAVELLNASAAASCGIESDRPWVVVVGLEEKAVTVASQKAALIADLKEVTWSEVADCDASVWDELAAFQSRPESAVIWKISTLPGAVARLAVALTAKYPVLIQAHAGNGILWVHALPGPITNAASVEAVVEPIGTADFPGRCMVRRAPVGWKPNIRIGGKPSGDRELMRHVKATLDPKNVFNPGRFV
jgi:glycolate oxidase FAD binding subunit